MRGEFDERVTFHPWVGERYWTGNRFGIRLLVLGESHYAVEGYAVQGEEHPKVTIEAVRNHTQPDTEHFERNRFFTVIANMLRSKPGWISDHDLADVFREIAFYNFVQSFIPDTRMRPEFRQWVDAQEPFKIVLEALRPEAVLVLGHELWDHILEKSAGIEFAYIAHPSSSRGGYDEAIPRFQNLLARTRRIG